MNVQEIDLCDEISEDDFKEILNENYPTVNICGYEMQQGDILQECDYVAFREMYNDYIDAESRDADLFECGECESRFDNYEDADACCRGREEEE